MKLGVLSLALSCLKTPKFMIYLSANRLRLFCDCYQLQSLEKNTVFSIQKDVYTQCTSLRIWTLCVQKKGNLCTAQIGNFEVMVTHTGCVSSLWFVPPCSPNRDPIHLYYSSFVSIHFGTEITNTFIHSRSSIENDTRFQTKMGKMQTRFQTKTAKKYIYPSGRHIPIWLI